MRRGDVGGDCGWHGHELAAGREFGIRTSYDALVADAIGLDVDGSGCARSAANTNAAGSKNNTRAAKMMSTKT
jgi:hypothetical protein